MNMIRVGIDRIELASVFPDYPREVLFNPFPASLRNDHFPVTGGEYKMSVKVVELNFHKYLLLI
jgi:hypothetical protein